MKCFAKTDLGKARELNEDSYYIPSDENELRIYMLADGMGGYNGGEIASKLAIESARKYLTNNFNTITHDRINIEELIRSSMEYANMVVFEKSKEIPELEGMGTTLELVLSYGNKIYIGHVGDSRIYRVRKNIIRKLTTDHSYVEKLVKEGTITREEAENHPKKNMLMKALGGTPYVEPDVTTKGFLKGDVLLLTSDGLTNMVSNQEIYDIVTNDVINAGTKLVELANDRGGYDNITVVIVYND
jgi:protein serine/threonine phosphatase